MKKKWIAAGIAAAIIAVVLGASWWLSRGEGTTGAKEIEIIVEGRGLQAVNALSFALPYEAQQLEFLGVEAPALEQMRNFTNDRLHTSGQKALYPTFVNIGDREEIEGDVRLMVIRFRARTDYRFDLKPVDGLLVNKRMDQKPF